MDRKTILQILGPAAAVGLIAVLLGVLLAPSDPTNRDKGDPTPLDESSAKPSRPTGDSVGMTLDLPSIEDPAWKAGPEGGLKVWDVTEGTGDPVPAGSAVRVHYTGWLTDGTIFDSSVKRNESIEFSLDGVIRGWTVGIPGMKIGGIRRLYIPSELGYGSRGSGRSIPPNSPLVFEVKLLGFNK